MSDELNKLQHRLEQATAAECPLDPVHEGETASLREGWLALGQLLEAAQPALAVPLDLPWPPERTPHVRRRLAIAAAAAASLLIGVTLAWKLNGNGEPGGASWPSGAVAAHEEPAEPSVAALSQAPQGPTAEELDWDDSLDQQIALVAQEVVRIQQDWYHLDDAFGPVHRGLEEMEEDLDQSPL